MLLTYLLQRHGVPPDAVSITAIGSAATAIAAVEHGRVDAGMLADPALTILVRRTPGTRILADLRTSAGVKEAVDADAYPASFLYAQHEWLRSLSETTQRHASAIGDNIKYTLTHT